MKNKKLKQLIEALDHVSYTKHSDIKNMTIKTLNQRPGDFDFFKSYRSIVKEMRERSPVKYEYPWIFDLTELGRIASIQSTFHNRVFANKEYFDIESECVRNCIFIDIKKIYPKLYVNAFKAGRLVVDEPGLLELMEAFDDNREYINDNATEKARTVMNVIENAFYGIITSKRPDGFKVRKNTPDFINEFYDELHSVIDVSKLAYINVDELCIPIRHYDEIKGPLDTLLTKYNLKYNSTVKHILRDEIRNSTRSQVGLKRINNQY